MLTDIQYLLPTRFTMILLIIAPTCFGLNSWPSSRTSQVFLICAAFVPALFGSSFTDMMNVIIKH